MYIINFDNNDMVNITGTSLQGRVATTYATLVECFGEPTYDVKDSGDGKVNAEWTIEFLVQEGGDEDQVVASIYDWKNMFTVLPTGEYLWHIGGSDRRAVDCVYQAMGLFEVETS